jgi:hypothetical protein
LAVTNGQNVPQDIEKIDAAVGEDHRDADPALKESERKGNG